MALDTGLWSLPHLLIGDNSGRSLIARGFLEGDTKLREERRGPRHFMVFEDAVDHGVYALFMT